MPLKIPYDGSPVYIATILEGYWSCYNVTTLYVNFGTSGTYLGQEEVIASRSLLWDVIIHVCPRYLRVETNSWCINKNLWQHNINPGLL